MRQCLFRLILAALGITFLGAAAPAGSLQLEEKATNEKKTSLVWNVNREISGVRIDVLEGTPIINTVKFMGGEEFQVGAHFSKGQHWERTLDNPARVGQLRVTLDKAQGSKIRLTVQPASEKQSGSPAASDSVKHPTKKDQPLVWDVNREIRGFEVVIREGNPIINTIRILGGEEFHVGAYMEKGKTYRKEFSARTAVGQIRVNVDKALGSAIELKTWD